MAFRSIARARREATPLYLLLTQESFAAPIPEYVQ